MVYLFLLRKVVRGTLFLFFRFIWIESLKYFYFVSVFIFYLCEGEN